MSSILRDNLAAVRERLAQAAARAGRDPGAVTLVAVTKGTDAERAAELARLGELDLGENRAPELADKAAALAAEGLAPRWHFLGHVQRNKARRIVELAHTIHSLDSLPLLATFARLADELDRDVHAFVELKTSTESTKTGLAPAELPAFLEAARAHPRVRLLGLMTMPPLAADETAREQAARAAFQALAVLARSLEERAETARAFASGRVRLSMGMSSDFEIAIEEGSDVVRVGSALFADERNAA